MSQLYIEFFYRHTIAEMLSWGMALVLVWLLLTRHAGKSERCRAAWITINRVLFVLTVLFILYWTLLNRESAEKGVSLIPFYSFADARVQPERYRGLVANVLLFIPFGLSLPFILPRHQARTAIITAFAVSVLIEGIQFAGNLGFCETDDVIMNTLGAAVGTLPWIIVNSGKKR